ncbi:MAG: trypsin-like peptidase domain-containing protein [Chloroflexota bacterium]
MKKAFLRLFTVILSLALTLALVGCPGLTIIPPATTTPSAGNPVATPTVTPVQPVWTPPATSGVSSPLPDMVAVVARVRPSVVSIDVTATSLDIFNRPYTAEGAGSGWIIDPNGLIVTNNHVIEGADTVTVTLSDGRAFTATKVSGDRLSDLAVVKIDATGLPAATVGDSSRLEVGMMVAAIGNSLGRGISMTGGWVSRLGVSITSQGQTLYDLIETDAAINPGNSGGPLVNSAGEVIGITSAKLVDINVEGVGYAIATNTAMPIIQELITQGYITRPYFGLATETVDLFLATRYGLPVDKGVLVVRVISGSPAEATGLKPGDVIVAVDGKAITTSDEMVQAIRSSQIGVKTRITYWRDSTKYETDLTPVTSPPPSP